MEPGGSLFPPSPPTSLALDVFCENGSDQVQVWTGPEERGQELCGQEAGMIAIGEVRISYFLLKIFCLSNKCSGNKQKVGRRQTVKGLICQIRNLNFVPEAGENQWKLSKKN